MKHILILILSLASFSGYSQTVGQFRYDTTKFLKVGGRNHVMIENLIQTSDSTVKPLVVGADGVIKRNSYWPGGSGGGSGSIEYILQGYGIKIDSTGRLYTVSVDTAEINNIIAGDTTIFQTSLDSTGQPNNRILFSRNLKVSSSPRLLIDSANSRVIINNANVSAGGANNKLFVGGQATVTGNMIVQSVPLSNDSTTYKPMVIGADGILRKAGYWRTGSGGEVTDVYAPLILSGDTISQRFNILHYGAIPNDGIDDTGPIQAAINAAGTAGAGEVIFPVGIYDIDGAINATYNSQLYIPHPASVTARGSITLKGEAANFIATPGGLLLAAGTQTPTNGVILRSRLSTFTTAGQAVIGTNLNTGVPNTNTLVIEDINIQVKNNPSGTGPVVGGISWKNGMNFQFNRVSAYIDTSGWYSTYPANDVSGIETPDGGYGEMYNINQCAVGGFRNGFKVGEHIMGNTMSAMVCYYALFIKDAAHPLTIPRMISQWCAYDIYVAAAWANISNINLMSEWQQASKWYDAIATIKDTANIATGSIHYSIVPAGTPNIDNTKFIKTGGSNINTYANSIGLPQLALSNNFTVPQTITTTTGTVSSLTVTNTSATMPSAISVSTSGVSGLDITSSHGTSSTIYNRTSNSASQSAFYLLNDRAAFDSYGGQLYGSSANGNSLFGLGRADRYMIFADGANNQGMVIGTLQAQPLYLGTNNTLYGTLSSAGALRLHAYGAGTLVTDGSGNITASSSKFVKHNIISLNYGLTEIKKIEPSTYIRNADSTNTVEPGFIAENIQDVFGGLGVGKSKDGVLSLNTNVILAAAVNAIKELSERVEKLEAEIKLLKK